jgi:hypothetical protein
MVFFIHIKYKKNPDLFLWYACLNEDQRVHGVHTLEVQSLIYAAIGM